jgi:hypothetical protein
MPNPSVGESQNASAKPQPLVLEMRIVWRLFLFTLIPTTIALLVAICLSLITKSAEVETHLVTHSASFTLLSDWHSGQEIEFVRSLPVKRVRLWIDSVELSAGTIAADQGPVTKAQTVLLRSHAIEKDPHTHAWVEFKTDHDAIVVSQIRLFAGAKVTISKVGQTLQLQVVPGTVMSRIQGNISLNGPTTMIVQDFEMTTDGKEIGVAGGGQQRFRITDPIDPLRFETTERVDLQLDISGKDEEVLGAFSDFLRVRDLSFPFGSGDTAIPIEEGSVTFRGIDKPTLDLKSGFLTIPCDDNMDIVTIGAKSGMLDLTMSGRTRSLKTGKVPDPDNEELPNLLSWLYHNQQLGIIFGVLVWVSGTVFGAVKLASDLKK